MTALAPAHPAKYSPPILAKIEQLLQQYCPPARPGQLLAPAVLDPFAGVGGVHQLGRLGYLTVGVELEPEWAAAHPGTLVGDATQLPFDAWQFDAAVTSPVYGNRMSDTYDGSRDRCLTCSGDGVIFAGDDDDIGDACDVCDGTGLKPSKRYTYRIALGRPLTTGNAGGLQWGNQYRALHRAAWAELARVLKPGAPFILNISDHVRGGALQGVDLWHANTLGRLGFDLERQIPVTTRRARNGANSELRDLCEWVLVFRAPGGTR